MKNGGIDERFEDPEVKAAIKYVRRKIKISTVKWFNKDLVPYADKENINVLLTWLVDQKNFSRRIWEARFKKAEIL